MIWPDPETMEITVTLYKVCSHCDLCVVADVLTLECKCTCTSPVGKTLCNKSMYLDFCAEIAPSLSWPLIIMSTSLLGDSR